MISPAFVSLSKIKDDFDTFLYNFRIAGSENQKEIIFENYIQSLENAALNGLSDIIQAFKIFIQKKI